MLGAIRIFAVLGSTLNTTGTEIDNVGVGLGITVAVGDAGIGDGDTLITTLGVSVGSANWSANSPKIETQVAVIRRNTAMIANGIH